MGWSYDPEHLELPLNQVRFLIGDTVAGDPLVEEDAEINFCLAQKGDDVYLAGAFALRRAATRLPRELSVVGGKGAVSLDKNTEAEALIKRAIELETEATRQGGANLFFGGISRTDVDARENNTDSVVPAFTTDKNAPAIQLVNDPNPDELWRW